MPLCNGDGEIFVIVGLSGGVVGGFLWLGGSKSTSALSSMPLHSFFALGEMLGDGHHGEIGP